MKDAENRMFVGFVLNTLALVIGLTTGIVLSGVILRMLTT